jgi:octaprenyl-diphosphate synthase
MTGAAAPARESAGAASLAAIQAPVKARLERVLPELQKIVAHELPLIQQVSQHLMQKKGKLFRPILTLLASDVEGRGEDRAVTLSAAIELMHLATLVHDDSVDHSALRRGLPTLNTVFSHEVSVIMGDFLYSRALGALVRLENLTVVRIMTDVTAELAVGEMRQLGSLDTLDFSEEAYVKTVSAKTGSLLSAACETGSLFGAERHQESLARYGDLLGIAFQIADDGLDYVADTSVTGKPSGLDLREHKVTLPLIGALPRMSKAERARVEALFAEKQPSDELVAEVMGIVADRGGLEHARQRGAHFAERANDALTTLPDTPARASLAGAIVYVMNRRS